jgi:hypothetical protein
LLWRPFASDTLKGRQKQVLGISESKKGMIYNHSMTRFELYFLELQDTVFENQGRQEWNRSARCLCGSNPSHSKPMWIARVTQRMDKRIVRFADAACAWTNVIQLIAWVAAAACVCTNLSLGAPSTKFFGAYMQGPACKDQRMMRRRRQRAEQYARPNASRGTRQNQRLSLSLSF